MRGLKSHLVTVQKDVVSSDTWEVSTSLETYQIYWVWHVRGGLSDFLGFWFDGSVTSGFPGLLVLWLSGFLVLRPSFLLSLRLPGLLAHLGFWFSSARVLWFYTGSLALCFSGFRAFLLVGTMVLWLLCFLFGSKTSKELCGRRS